MSDNILKIARDRNSWKARLHELITLRMLENSDFSLQIFKFVQILFRNWHIYLRMRKRKCYSSAQKWQRKKNNYQPYSLPTTTYDINKCERLLKLSTVSLLETIYSFIINQGLNKDSCMNQILPITFWILLKFWRESGT